MEEQSPNQLATVDLLSGLAPEALQRLAQGCMWRRYKRGEEIVARDSDSRDLFLVVTGSVEVANFSTTGRKIAYQPVDEVCSGRVSLCLILCVSDLIGGLSDVDGAARGSAV